MSTSKLLDQLAAEARRLKVGQKLPAEDPIPWEAIERVRDDFRYLLDNSSVTITALAEAAGDLSRGPLSRFRGCTSRQDFNGNLDHTARRVNQLMETLGRRALASVSDRPDGFVETEVARRILLVVSKTVEMQAMGLITSDAGRGKTLNAAGRRGHPPPAACTSASAATRGRRPGWPGCWTRRSTPSGGACPAGCWVG